MHNFSQSPQFEGIRAPFRARRDPDATYGIFASSIDSATGEIAFDPSAQMGSTTTATASQSRFRRFAPAGLGQARVRKRQLTFEEVIRWKLSDRVRLLGGVNLLTEKIRQHIDIRRLTGIGDFADRQVSLGAFGEAEWRPAKKLTLTAAVRLQRDRQDRTGEIVGIGPPTTLDYHGRFGSFLPKLSIRWSPTDRLTFGGFTQKAYNPGGSTLLLNGVTDSFGAETMWGHELFIRGSDAAQRIRWSANLFLQQFRNAQRPQSEHIDVPGGSPLEISSLANAPRARSTGVEGEIIWRLNNQFSLTAGIGLLRTRITRTLVDSDPIQGKQFQRAPHVSGSASIEWRPVKPLTLLLLAHGNSDYFSDDSNSPGLRIGRGALIDAKASFDFGPLQLSGYARNLTNRFQLTYLFSPTLATAADPREVGVELGARF